MNLSDVLPLSALSLSTRKLVEEDNRLGPIRAGEASYRAGLTLSSCPHFKVEDMAIGWRQGWRNARDRSNSKGATK